MATRSSVETEERTDTGLSKMADKYLRGFLALEFGRTDANIKWVDSHLLLTEGKLDCTAQINKQLQGEAEALKQDVSTIDKNAIALEKGSWLLKEGFADVNKDLYTVQSCAENIGNLLRKNNLHIWEVK